MDLCDEHAHVEEEYDEAAIVGEVLGNNLVEAHSVVHLIPQWAVDRDLVSCGSLYTTVLILINDDDLPKQVILFGLDFQPSKVFSSPKQLSHYCPDQALSQVNTRILDRQQKSNPFVLSHTGLFCLLQFISLTQVESYCYLVCALVQWFWNL